MARSLGIERRRRGDSVTWDNLSHRFRRSFLLTDFPFFSNLLGRSDPPRHHMHRCILRVLSLVAASRRMRRARRRGRVRGRRAGGNTRGHARARQWRDRDAPRSVRRFRRRATRVHSFPTTPASSPARASRRRADERSGYRPGAILLPICRSHPIASGTWKLSSVPVMSGRGSRCPSALT